MRGLEWPLSSFGEVCVEEVWLFESSCKPCHSRRGLQERSPYI
jgi:hypothetical protein